MKNRTLLLLSILLATISAAFPQGHIGFAYDEAGNRVRREIIIEQNRIANKIPDQGKTYYDSSVGLTVKFTYHSSGVIEISVQGFSSEDTGYIEIYSLSSVPVHAQDITDSLTVLDIGGQPDGIYILSVIVNERQTSWKITKR